MKAFFKTALMIAALGTSVSTPAIAAIKAQDYVIVMYATDAHETIVGQNIFFCDGTMTHVGGYSVYFERIDYNNCG